MVNIAMLIRGRLRLSQQTLQSLYANTREKEFTCTVVSDSEDDFRVRNLLRSYLDHKNFSLLEVNNSGHVLSQLKNLAIGWSSQRFGRGDWLYISDGDVFFTPAWLTKLTECAIATEPDFALWGGQIHPFHKPFEPATSPTEHAVLDGPSWLMRWKTWNTVGPFSRRNEPGPCRSEEYPWCERLITQGRRIGVIQPHCVIHTGLTQTDGKDAPGRAERAALIPESVIAE